MGLHCEINLFKPTDGAFKPGSIVAGSIKYAVDENTVFKKITVSMRGSGQLSMKKHRQKNSSVHTFRNHEDYVHIENVIHNDENGHQPLPIGSYETQFSFVLPQKIPSSLSYLRNVPRYTIRCYINYFVRIKFERPGVFKFDKKFKKEITVVSGIIPRLTTVPTVCGEEKTLTKLFSSKKSVINIKATVQTYIIKPGGKINFEYEVNNDTNVVIKGVEAKLVEKHTFTSRNGKVVYVDDIVKDTDFKTPSIKAGEVQKMPGEINVPSDKLSLGHSEMVARDYFVQIVVNVPFPHRDAVLNIPVQIGDTQEPALNSSSPGMNDAPPSYWEAMAEDSEKVKDVKVNDDEGGSEEEQKD